MGYQKRLGTSTSIRILHVFSVKSAFLVVHCCQRDVSITQHVLILSIGPVSTPRFMVDKKVGFRRLPCISGLNMINPIEKNQISCPSWLFSPAQEALRQKLAEAEASPKMGEIPIDNGDAMIAVM